uniref:Uncharacterized protein n=1 Tax=Populus trichocarpa TaxID=3694 RepID=A0A3N7HV08_POPTR
MPTSRCFQRFDQLSRLISNPDFHLTIYLFSLVSYFKLF